MERIEYKGYFIDRTEYGYRICKENDTEIHTHLRNLTPSYKLIDNVVGHKIPTRCGLYYIQSRIRLASNEEYRQRLQDYYNVKLNKGKKQDYYNPSKKKF